MLVPPVGIYTPPVTPVTPAAPVQRKPKAAEKQTGGRPGASRPARTANAMTSHTTCAALDDIKLGG